MLVEPACGAALAAVYADIIPTLDLPQGDIGKLGHSILSRGRPSLGLSANTS